MKEVLDLRGNVHPGAADRPLVATCEPSSSTFSKNKKARSATIGY